MISFWVDVANFLGYPRSIGEIYGLIFLSEHPLSADDVAERLHISRSGAGQGLKTLLDIGAIRPAHQIASRKEHFRLETDLSVLVKQILNTRVFSPLEQILRDKNRLAAAAAAHPSTVLVHRFDKLQRWEEKARPVAAILRALT